ASITPSAEETTVGTEYEVKEGDSLWTIAEKEYKDGFKWTEIAKANKLGNPDLIEKGMKLTLPEITRAEVEEDSKIEGEKITGDSYRVVEGDNLWDISVRAYGDGFKWPGLAKENKISNPDLIYPDDTIKLPR
ncbi:MAG: LysM peptidoglycan-binding domain-containing protein, partial [Candidatus Levybacteria bacterium]|nr:LysM peptidoglycan-binding domain-containing protein [Candidatus Levybacteria bacterium]